VRLDKFVARSLSISRKEAKELIREGRVRVNGTVVRNPDYRLKEGERVEVEGKEISYKEKVYLKLYKPRGYLSTTEKEHRYPSFLELLEEHYGGRKLFAAGRLDVDAEGLLIVTDDGELAHRITHPKWKVEKEYEVVLDRNPSPEILRSLHSVELDGRPVALKSVEIIGDRKLRLVLTEGRFHVVKRLLKAVGFNVLSLKRTRIGSIKLDPYMEPGEWRELSEEEIKTLKEVVKL